jgi:hypothetical protein
MNFTLEPERDEVEESKSIEGANNGVSEIQNVREIFGEVFSPKIDPTGQIQKVLCIRDYAPLLDRYNPKRHCKYRDKFKTVSIELILKMNKMQSEFDRNLESPDWELTVDNMKEDVKLWQKFQNEGNFQTIKTIGTINAPPEVVQRVISNNKAYRAKYDPKFDSSLFIERIAD